MSNLPQLFGARCSDGSLNGARFGYSASRRSQLPRTGVETLSACARKRIIRALRCASKARCCWLKRAKDHSVQVDFEVDAHIVLFIWPGCGQRMPEVRSHSAWITTSRSSSTNLMIHHHRHQNHHQMIHGLANLETAMFSLGSIGTPKAFRCAPKARWRAEGALSFRD